MAEISVVIPVLDEQRVLGRLLESLRAMEPAPEVIVADGGSSDGTVAVARAFGARAVVSARGRGPQMNAGAAASSGAVLLFLHADVTIGPTALSALERALAGGGVVGGNFDIRYEGGWEARLFSAINRRRCRMGVIYGDSGIFCRRDVFEKLGGYRDWPLLEDYEFARRLRRAGKLALLAEPVYVSGRRWRNGGLWKTLWAWFWVQALYYLGVSPRRLAAMYRDVR
ncbi:MAG: TIGR04283 family arsenosugar biosynthesis glycosyltransferase [Bryobacteraceae bacterium]